MTDLQDEQILGRVVKLLDANKALAAWLTPLVLALGSSASSWLVTGNFSGTELRLAAAGTILSAAGGLAAYRKSTTHAVVTPVAPVVESAPEG